MAARVNRISAVPDALMRIVTGLLFLCHGTEKLFDFPREFEGDPGAFVLYTAGIIELAGVYNDSTNRSSAWAASTGLVANANWLA